MFWFLCTVGFVIWMLIGAAMIQLWNGWVGYYDRVDDGFMHIVAGIGWPVLVLIILAYFIGVTFGNLGNYYKQLSQWIGNYAKEALKRRCCDAGAK